MRFRACLVLGLLAILKPGFGASPYGAGGPVTLQQSRLPGRVEVSARNRDPYTPAWIWVSFSSPGNAYASPSLPAGFVLRPLERRRLFAVRPLNPGEGYSFGLTYSCGEGDPRRDPDPKELYLLPYAHGTKHVVSQGYFGRISHLGLYALDFAMPDGTDIDAARAGVVIAVKQDSSRGGASALYAKDGNYIEVMHADSTWAIYAHLRQGGALVRRGQRVRAGQAIALSGHTGEATGPHLHFAVYRADWDGPRSIPTLFLTGPATAASLEEGRTYYSWHPGGAPFTRVLGEDLRDRDFRGLTRTARGRGVSLRYQVVDRRNLVWADNATDGAVDLRIDAVRAEGVRFGASLPFSVTVPAHTEVYCFHLDYVGEGSSSFALKTSWLEAR
ncbi:MAG TPA: M23 family metallopeptidase [bacterium]|jgi:murein DD-endopeptidase MepM/ murein hydrolase activator NlpD|nr:M23 family metallopeptidase [bacterium]